MPLLFSYGTLQQGAVQMSLFGRLLQGQPDALVGFERSTIEMDDSDRVTSGGKVLHAIVKWIGGDQRRVDGTVLEVTDEELSSADRYEPPPYKRIATVLASGKQSWVYADGREAVDVLGAIGDTSLVRLRKVVPPGCADVWVKLEWENPTGSLKDRMALAVITRAEEDGRLRPGGTVVEYTGGSTGTSLAFVCAAKGYRLRIVTSDAFSREKRDHMAALGAELTLVPSEGGLTTKKLILDMIEAARDLSREPGTYWTDQLNNQDGIAGYFPLGEEIWSQTGGTVDAFVHCVGTAASSRGVATVLKRHRAGVRIVAVEPGESSVLLGGRPGPHKIEGVGIGYVPPLWEPSLVDEIVPVPTAEAKEMTRRLAREEALFAGTSSGANVIAAIEVGRRLGPGRTVVTLMADSGLKYLSTDVYGGR
jgi:cysteine synthase A